MTPTEIYTAILAVCGAIITVSSAVTIIIKAVRAAKAPEDAQNDRLTKLEARMARYDELFANDNRTITAVDTFLGAILGISTANYNKTGGGR